MEKTMRPVDDQFRSGMDRWLPILLPVVLFLAFTLLGRQSAVVLMALALLSMLHPGMRRRLLERGGILCFAVSLYVGVSLLSGLWSHYGDYAGSESGKILAAFGVFLFVVGYVPREQLRPFLGGISGALAAVALLCIDGASWQLLSQGFIALMKLLGSSYTLEQMGYESGIRITGIFNNGNVSAGMLAFGLFLSLFLYRTTKNGRAKALYVVLLGVQALGFFLSFSMGAMAAFGIGCILYLVFSEKEERLGLFLLMLECVIATVVCAFAAYPNLGQNSVMPVLLAVSNGGLILLLDHAGSRIEKKLAGHSTLVWGLIGFLVAILVVYVGLAFRLTGAVTLQANETLNRAVALPAGTYTVTVEGIDPQVYIYTQNEAELMMHTHTGLYQGELSKAQFTVPEDSRIVWFQLQGDGAITRITLSDGTQVPLDYTLLPGFAANRLQGLWANQNFIQRLVFFQDGLALWKQRPLFGWGLGGVEGQLTAVQSFYYESKYIHNHAIQLLAETGVIGLAAFLFLLGSAIWMLVQQKRHGAGTHVGMLAACFAMTIVHSMTEVVWSHRGYQTVVFCVLAALILACDTLQTKSMPAKCSLGLASGVGILFTVLLVGNIVAVQWFQKLDLEQLSPKEFVQAAKTVDFLDVYDDKVYKVNAMPNALQLEQYEDARRFADSLTQNMEYDSCYYVATYYHLQRGDLEAFFQTMQIGLAQERSNPSAWDSAFHLFAKVVPQISPDYTPEFLTGVQSVITQMEEANQTLLAPIVLDEGNQKLVSAVQDAAEQVDTDPELAYVLLLTSVSSRSG